MSDTLYIYTDFQISERLHKGPEFSGNYLISTGHANTIRPCKVSPSVNPTCLLLFWLDDVIIINHSGGVVSSLVARGLSGFSICKYRK